MADHLPFEASFVNEHSLQSCMSMNEPPVPECDHQVMLAGCHANQQDIARTRNARSFVKTICSRYACKVR